LDRVRALLDLAISVPNTTGINYDLPESFPRNMEIRMAYSMPKSEEQHVAKALVNCGKKVYEKVDTGNGSVTYLFS
jgi:hypothetical protein